MDYTGNSHKSKKQAGEETEEKPKKVVEPVVTGEVIIKKPTVGQKFKTLFFGGEAKGVTRYLTADVLLPALRNLIVDATTKGIERMVYGEVGPRRPRPMGPTSRVQYHSPISRERPRLPDQSGYSRAQHDSRDLILVSREEAELVLERLSDIVQQYEIASVADLYELTGQPVAHVDNKFGWTDLRTASIKQVREGYLLSLPPTEEI